MTPPASTEPVCPWRKDAPKKYCGMSAFNKREIAEMSLALGAFAGFFLGLALGGML